MNFEKALKHSAKWLVIRELYFFVSSCLMIDLISIIFMHDMRHQGAFLDRLPSSFNPLIYVPTITTPSANGDRA